MAGLRAHTASQRSGAARGGHQAGADRSPRGDRQQRAVVRPEVIAHAPRDVAAVALTFDDGPGSVTPAILRALHDRGARATFNLLGARVRHGAPLVRRAVAGGPGSIVLLHDDRPGLAATADALPGILDDLAERGLEAVTVSSLLAPC